MTAANTRDIAVATQAHVENLTKKVDAMDGKLDELLAQAQAVKGGWSVLHVIYPPASAFAVWLVAHFGLAPLPR
jgi:hypothetical protein